MDSVFGRMNDDPIRQVLQEEKDAGRWPVAKVIVTDGDVQCVILKLGSVDYYFHQTKGPEGELRIHKEDQPIPGEPRTVYTVPYDGWNVSYGGE